MSACFGGQAPVERYIHLPAVQAVCPAETANTTPADDRPILAVRPFSAFPALSRTAVLLAEGPVQRPSLSLSWEAVPADLMTQAVVNTLACSSERTILWPYSGRSPHDAVLMGRVTTFKVDTKASFFTAALHLDLYGPRSKSWLAGARFTSEQRLRDLSPASLAEAADAAVADITARVDTWLADKGELVSGAVSQAGQ